MALDQAFIKAYTRQDVPPADTPRRVAPSPAPTAPTENVPISKATGTPVDVSIDGLLAAIDQTPAGTAHPVALVPLRPRPQELGETEADVIHRIDPGSSPALTTMSGNAKVPAPHIENIAEALAPTAPNIEVPADDVPPVEVNSAAAETTSAESPAPSFQPMLQVDRFNWPKVCRRLAGQAGQELDRVADALEAAMTQGSKVLAIGACRRGEGATTLLLGAAQRLAERGFKVVMVDADLTQPKLARRLQLLPESGWEETLAGRVPLEELVIESADNGLALLPVCEPFPETTITAEVETRMVEGIETLAANYDLVLIDPGPLEDFGGAGPAWPRALARRLDAVALVHKARATSPQRLAELQHALSDAGIPLVGVIQNFVRD